MLSPHYNGSNSFSFFNAVRMYQFKAKDSEIKAYSSCLGNISKDFTLNNMNNTGLKGIVKVFSVDYNPISTSDILDIHRYLMKETQYETILRVIGNMFIVLLTSIVNASNHTKCITLSNQKLQKLAYSY